MVSPHSIVQVLRESRLALFALQAGRNQLWYTSSPAAVVYDDSRVLLQDQAVAIIIDFEYGNLSNLVPRGLV